MTLRSVLLFPGQGAQTPNYLHALPEHEAVRATLRDAQTILQLDPSGLDSAAALNSTVSVQLGVLIAGVRRCRRRSSSAKTAACSIGISTPASWMQS